MGDVADGLSGGVVFVVTRGRGIAADNPIVSHTKLSIMKDSPGKSFQPSLPVTRSMCHAENPITRVDLSAVHRGRFQSLCLARHLPENHAGLFALAVGFGVRVRLFRTGRRDRRGGSTALLSGRMGVDRSARRRVSGKRAHGRSC